MAKLPKWAIKQAGGINKKAWALYRARLRSTKRKRSKPKARARTRRRSPRKKTTKTRKRRSGTMNFNFGGGLGKGIMAGVVTGVVNRFIPVNIAGADLIIAGMIMKDSTVQKIGAITLGRSLSQSFAGALGGGGQNGGFGGY